MNILKQTLRLQFSLACFCLELLITFEIKERGWLKALSFLVLVKNNFLNYRTVFV